MTRTMSFVAAIALAGAAQATEPAPGSICTKHTQHRSTAAVLQDHLAALMTGDADLVACDYAADAYLILPGSVAKGVEQIGAGFRSLFTALGPNPAMQLLTVTIEGETVLVEWRAEGQHLIVGDGVDTIVVRDGLIVAQTVRMGDQSTR